MKVSLRSVVVVFVMLSTFPAVAGRVGFLDAERAVASVQEGKRQLQALDAWAKPRRERVEQMRADLVELDKQLTAQRSVATADVIQDLESGFLQARRELEDAGRSFNRDLDAKQNEFLEDVATKIGKVASDYGRANDFDAIFVLNAQPLVFVRDSSDVTDTVIRLYDDRFPVN